MVGLGRPVVPEVKTRWEGWRVREQEGGREAEEREAEERGGGGEGERGRREERSRTVTLELWEDGAVFAATVERAPALSVRTRTRGEEEAGPVHRTSSISTTRAGGSLTQSNGQRT